MRRTYFEGFGATFDDKSKSLTVEPNAPHSVLVAARAWAGLPTLEAEAAAKAEADLLVELEAEEKAEAAKTVAPVVPIPLTP